MKLLSTLSEPNSTPILPDFFCLSLHTNNVVSDINFKMIYQIKWSAQVIQYHWLQYTLQQAFWWFLMSILQTDHHKQFQSAECIWYFLCASYKWLFESSFYLNRTSYIPSHFYVFIYTNCFCNELKKEDILKEAWFHAILADIWSSRPRTTTSGGVIWPPLIGW